MLTFKNSFKKHVNTKPIGTCHIHSANTMFAISEEGVCLPSTNCPWNTGTLTSKSMLGDFASYTETWQLSAVQHTYINLRLISFDIGCNTNSIFEIHMDDYNKHVFCNSIKPLGDIRSLKQNMKIVYTFGRALSFLREGFEAQYSLQSRQDTTSGLISEESIGICDVFIFLKF